MSAELPGDLEPTARRPLAVPHLLARKWHSFARLSGVTRALLPPAWLLLGLGRLAVLAVPFRRLAPWLGRDGGIAPWLPLVTPGQDARARQLATALGIAARYTPWQSNCFAQAIAARLLLGLLGVPYALYFGVARGADATDPGALQAHAWVRAGRVQVCGGPGFDQFTVVGCYVASGLGDDAGARRR